jgi:hypothetical protein
MTLRPEGFNMSSKDILSEYGPERTSGSRASNGGKPEVKPLPYDTPVGPKNQTNPGPGLRGGTNHGNAGTQGKR